MSNSVSSSVLKSSQNFDWAKPLQARFREKKWKSTNYGVQWSKRHSNLSSIGPLIKFSILKSKNHYLIEIGYIGLHVPVHNESCEL